ncbi:hypothetical protein GJU35_06850 [Streptomyces lincolnensis]|nr:hypothetical protein GJU35_06850 [Streptomyces lincolnensis]
MASGSEDSRDDKPAPESSSGSPKPSFSLPTELPSELPSQLPTELPSGFPSDLPSDLESLIPSLPEEVFP